MWVGDDGPKPKPLFCLFFDGSAHPVRLRPLLPSFSIICFVERAKTVRTYEPDRPYHNFTDRNQSVN